MPLHSPVRRESAWQVVWCIPEIRHNPEPPAAFAMCSATRPCTSGLMRWTRRRCAHLSRRTSQDCSAEMTSRCRRLMAIIRMSSGMHCSAKWMNPSLRNPAIPEARCFMELSRSRGCQVARTEMPRCTRTSPSSGPMPGRCSGWRVFVRFLELTRLAIGLNLAMGKFMISPQSTLNRNILINLAHPNSLRPGCFANCVSPVLSMLAS